MMRIQISTLFVFLCFFIPILGMAQTNISYTYDSAGNRTGRSAPVQTMAGVTDIPSVESVAISKIVSQLMATPVNGVHLSKEAVSIPVRSETALWAAGPFPGPVLGELWGGLINRNIDNQKY